MYLFIATIFIAEIIIAVTLINYIVKADKFVQKCSIQVMQTRPCFEKMLKDLGLCVSNFGEYYNYMVNLIKKKQRQFQITLIKNIAMYLSLFLLKGRYKRVAAFLQFAVLFYDYWVKIHTDNL